MTAHAKHKTSSPRRLLSVAYRRTPDLDLTREDQVFLPTPRRLKKFQKINIQKCKHLRQRKKVFAIMQKWLNETFETLIPNVMIFVATFYSDNRGRDFFNTSMRDQTPLPFSDWIKLLRMYRRITPPSKHVWLFLRFRYSMGPRVKRHVVFAAVAPFARDHAKLVVEYLDSNGEDLEEYLSTASYRHYTREFEFVKINSSCLNKDSEFKQCFPRSGYCFYISMYVMYLSLHMKKSPRVVFLRLISKRRHDEESYITEIETFIGQLVRTMYRKFQTTNIDKIDALLTSQLF